MREIATDGGSHPTPNLPCSVLMCLCKHVNPLHTYISIWGKAHSSWGCEFTQFRVKCKLAQQFLWQFSWQHCSVFCETTQPVTSVSWVEKPVSIKIIIPHFLNPHIFSFDEKKENKIFKELNQVHLLLGYVSNCPSHSITSFLQIPKVHIVMSALQSADKTKFQENNHNFKSARTGRKRM